MRLARIELTRYGKFTDRSLDLPQQDVDLHLIVGPNEAGKSTLRQAILDLFYDIPVRTPLGFKHGKSEMVIGGVLTNGGAPFAFQRFKRAKNPLINAAGEPFPEAELLQRLGGSDRAFYQRNFGLDHKTLVEGGKAILDSSGDAGQTLFQAAAGIAGLHKLQLKLEEEASALWAERKRGGTAYHDAFKAYDEAEARLREVGVSNNKWQTAKRGLQAAQDALDNAKEEYQRAEAMRERLERVRRVSPAVAEMRAAQSARKALGNPAPLPIDAAKTLADVEIEIERAAAEERLHNATMLKDRDELEALVRRPALVAGKAQITDLAGRVREFLKASVDVTGVEQKVYGKRMAVLDAARQVGWTETDIGVITAKVPSQLVRAEIESLLRSRTTVEADATRTAKAVADQNTSLDKLEENIRNWPGLAPTPALNAALAEARALAVGETLPKARQKVQEADRKLTQELTGLRPWVGDAAALQGLILPTTGEAQVVSKAVSDLAGQLAALAPSLRAKELDAVQAKAVAEAALQQGDLVTPEALGTGRQQRDELWQSLRADVETGTLTGNDASRALWASKAEMYAGRVSAADGLADRRYARAAKNEEAVLQAAQSRVLDKAVETLKRQVADLETAAQRHQKNWTDRLTPLGLGTLAPDDLILWLQKRTMALTALAARDAARGELDSLEMRIKDASSELRAALTTAGDPPPAAADLATLIVCAETYESRRVKQQANYDATVRDRDTAKSTLPALFDEADGAEKAWTAWQANWTKYIAAAGLAADIGTIGAEKALALFATMESDCATIVDQETTRIGPMQAAIRKFTEDAQALAAAHLPDAPALQPADIATRLAAALADAERVDTEWERLTKALVKTDDERRAAVERGAAASAKLAPLFAAANVVDRDELRAAIHLADECRDAEKREREAAATAGNGGDGLPLERLTAEVDEEDPALLPQRISEAKADRDAAEQRRTEAVRAHTQAEDAYKKIAGGDEAAIAESKRQGALMLMGDAVDEYVRVMLGARLLKAAIERYREEKQGPLLKRASTLFATLTCGAYEKLSLNFDTDPVTLTAHRPDNTMVSLDGLSTGTESQLYLALRLAALELHLEGATALPFLCDDCFVDWDDTRCGAGFAALAQIADKTQVIVLTHHEHLIEVARRATDDHINVHRL